MNTQRFNFRTILLPCFIILITYVSNNIYCLTDKDKVLPKTNSDTASINQTLRSAMKHYKSNPDATLILARGALNASKVINYRKGIADAYSAMGFAHFMNYGKSDSCQLYFEKALVEYRELNDSNGIGLANYGLGYFYSVRGNLEQSEKCMLKSLDAYKKTNNLRGLHNTYSALSYINKEFKDYTGAYDYIYRAIETAKKAKHLSAVADHYNSLGNIYKDQGMFQHAIDTYFKALTIWETEEDSLGMAIAYGSIGNMYYYQKDYEKALEFQKKKIRITQKGKTYWELSKSYNSLAHIFNEKHLYDSSLFYLQLSLQSNLMMNYQRGIADSYYNLSVTYLLKYQSDTALSYVNKSIQIARDINEKALLPKYYIQKGKIYYSLQENQLALQNINKAYSMAKELDIPFVISDAAELLSKIYVQLGKYKLAYENLSRFKLLQDSLRNDEHIKRITQLEMQYDFDKKQRLTEYENKQKRQADQAKLKQQKIIFIGLIILIVFIATLGLLFIRQKNLENRFKTINLEQKLLRMQMKPHFLFNSLTAIQEYLLENNAGEASRFLTKFAALMRQILENSGADYLPVEKELDMLHNYLEIQKMRFEQKFNYEFKVDNNIDQELIAVPPMLAQPFIENSIEHGLIPLKGKGKIIVQLKKVNGLLYFQIEDNGIGRKKSLQLKDNVHDDKKSLAITITKERLRYLRKQTGKAIDFRIEDLYKEDEPIGTRVTFGIPIQKVYT